MKVRDNLKIHCMIDPVTAKVSWMRFHYWHTLSTCHVLVTALIRFASESCLSTLVPAFRKAVLHIDDVAFAGH